jgi:hypothetical protein
MRKGEVLVLNDPPTRNVPADDAGTAPAIKRRTVVEERW